MKTLDELVRFEGVHFQVFNKNNSKGIESSRFGKMVFDREGAFEQMEEIAAAASEAMFEAKEMIYDLRPIQLDRFGLTKVLKCDAQTSRRRARRRAVGECR